MYLRHYTDVSALPVAMEGAERVLIRNLITSHEGAPTFAMRIFDVEPGGHTPLHQHDYEHEIFILEGEGELTEGRNIHPLVPGGVVFIPPGTAHQFRNPGDKVFRFMCLIPHHEAAPCAQPPAK